jgi:hypothetical protein
MAREFPTGLRINCENPTVIHDEIIREIDNFAGMTRVERLRRATQQLEDFFFGRSTHVMGHEHIWQLKHQYRR